MCNLIAAEKGLSRFCNRIIGISGGGLNFPEEEGGKLFLMVSTFSRLAKRSSSLLKLGVERGDNKDTCIPYHQTPLLLTHVVFTIDELVLLAVFWGSLHCPWIISGCTYSLCSSESLLLIGTKYECYKLPI